MYSVKKIEDVCSIIPGQSPPSASYNTENRGLPFFQGNADFNKKHPSVRYWCTEPKKLAEPNDILISVRAPVGAVNINQVQACIGRGLAALRCSNNLSLEYLFHFLKYQRKRIEDLGTGSTFKAITIKTLKSIKIPLPPLKTQKQIASILDDAQALKQKTEQLLKEYDQLAQSIFLDMFGDPVTNPKGWEYSQLHNLGKISTGSTPSSKKEGMFNGAIPFVTPSDLDTEKNYSRTVTKNGANNSRLVKKGALLVCCIGATIGKRRMVNKDVAFNQQINAIEWGDRINSKFGYYSFHWVKQIVIKKAISTTLPILKKSEFEKIKLITPPIHLQNQFAEKIALIEQQKDLAKQELKESEDLFQALLQKAFKGELV